MLSLFLKMSCSGCRALRKGCSEECMLRQSLECIQSPEAQAHATLFLSKFFGRASLLSFLSHVPPSQRPRLFESLLYEAVGRSINPVNGAVGLLWTGNWHLCQIGVDTVLAGGALTPLPIHLTTSFPAYDHQSLQGQGEGDEGSLRIRMLNKHDDHFQSFNTTPNKRPPQSLLTLFF